jgi:hypothetical protein
MKKGVCIHYLAHRGIGKIVKEADDWKKTDKEFKQHRFSDIRYHGCGADMKTARKNYNIDMEKKRNEARLLRAERKKLRNSKKSKKSKKSNKKSKKKSKSKSWINWINGLF